ncbi:AAA family ATPase [Prevotella histicola]
MSFKRLDTNEFIKAAKEYNAFDGYKCGIKSIDEIMRIDKQTLTTLVATPASGKSTFTNFYGYQMAKFNNWKTLYIAEETPQDRQCRMLSILFDSAAKASEFSVLYDYELSEWNDLLMMIKDAKEKYGVDMVILDNFMMLKNLITGNDSETEKIGRALSALKKAAIDTDTAIILVAHPTKLLEGQEVTAYSVNGSANFFNISDYMFSLAVTDRENYETTIKVLKVRDSAKGVMGGKCTLKYNPVHFTYSDTASTKDNTPKGINYPIAREVMKEKEEEAKQAKQEDSQPATQPAGTTKAAPAAKQEAKEEKQHITPDFLHNTKVSIMGQHKVLDEYTLYNAIMLGRNCKEEIAKVRRIDRQANESEYKKAKEKVLSYTPSCVCQGETAKEVKEINALIAVDLDAKDNEGVTIEEMRKKINSLPYVMYSSLSVGGKGMYALIPILESNKNDFKGVFNALNEDFKALGLTLDSSCVNVNRERYMSFDDNEYWNDKAEIYTKKISIPTQVNTTLLRGGDNAKPLTPREYNKVKSMVEDIKANKLQLTKNHTDTLMLANCIANVWGENGRELIHIIRSQREGYDEFKTDRTFDDMLYNNEDNERYGVGFLISKYKEAKQGQTQVN